MTSVSADTVRSMRRFVASCVVALAVAGCSSAADEPQAGLAPSVPPTVDESAAAKAGASEIAATTVPDDDQPSPIYEVAVDVSIDRLDLAERLDVSIDPSELDDIDPFTRFSSCSGLRASIGTYTVTAVDDTSRVRSVSVVTSGRVSGPGIYDAGVRVESEGVDPVSATGTLTLDLSLRSGTYQAFEATGEAVSGSFACDGPGGTPVPIVDEPADDGLLRSVEVVALLRRGAEERIVGLTLDPAEVAAADAECPGVAEADDDVVVRVEGGQAIGAITTFVLAAEPVPSLRMSVGGAAYELTAADIAIDSTGATGSFSGVTDDGIAVDGAFRCA